MPEYASVFLNLPEWLMFYMSPAVIPCECVVDYFNVYTKRSMKEHEAV